MFRALTSNAVLGGGRQTLKSASKASPPLLQSLVKSRQYNKAALQQFNNNIRLANNQQWRCLSTNNGNKQQQTDEATTSEIVLTPGQKVVAASRLTLWGGIAVFASICGYYIVKELMPTKMSPNRVFDRSLELVRADPEVKRRYGDNLKAFGRDHGGHREGRRNFIEHTEYVDKQDGSKRTRVRYNLEGRFGVAFVFAEVSSSMSSGEFVYILVQDKSNGRVHSVVDNRAALVSEQLSGGNKEAQSAMSQLLSGTGGK